MANLQSRPGSERMNGHDGNVLPIDERRVAGLVGHFAEAPGADEDLAAAAIQQCRVLRVVHHRTDVAELCVRGKKAVELSEKKEVRTPTIVLATCISARMREPALGRYRGAMNVVSYCTEIRNKTKVEITLEFLTHPSCPTNNGDGSLSASDDNILHRPSPIPVNPMSVLHVDEVKRAGCVLLVAHVCSVTNQLTYSGL